ncbi:MBL fold metallo-hydrolase [Herbiconiux moechotypicola]|uniref:MBL fold metallo-hydrolase n=1 Tax=Herbiconiux moechotypicola TaxID=637393 RepID=A0ABP5QX57_9MICO|nr:MBL fold metallo-hydrolase [Herbiconiux moechotypicola]MCS5731342.1 MBL fold metallo-hydrolase [Herbiconiux moechotypicola]
MADTIQIGDFTVTVLTDGASYLPPSAYPGADFSQYPGLLDDHGTHKIRIGAHLVQGPAGTFLIDAGAGELVLPFPPELAAANDLQDPPPNMASAGALPSALTDAGVTVDEIEHIFITHLHLDHVGWLMKNGQPFFPRATAYFGREDWAELVDNVPQDDPARVLMHEAENAGILRTYEPEDVEVLPGVTAMHVPGHTPGHMMIQLESKGEKLWFVGDLIEHPGQLTDSGIHFMTDVDRDRAASERARLFAQAKEESIVIAAAHLDNPVFRRISADDTWTDATHN